MESPLRNNIQSVVSEMHKNVFLKPHRVKWWSNCLSTCQNGCWCHGAEEFEVWRRYVAQKNGDLYQNYRMLLEYRLFGVFDGMTSGVEMCGYQSAREIGSDGSEMIGEPCWQSSFGLANIQHLAALADNGIDQILLEFFGQNSKTLQNHQTLPKWAEISFTVCIQLIPFGACLVYLRLFVRYFSFESVCIFVETFVKGVIVSGLLGL